MPNRQRSVDLVPRHPTFALAYRHMRGTIDPRRGRPFRRRTLRRVRWRAIAMTGIEVDVSPCLAALVWTKSQPR